MTRPTPLDDDERWLVGIGAQVRPEDKDDEADAEADDAHDDEFDHDRGDSDDDAGDETLDQPEVHGGDDDQGSTTTQLTTVTDLDAAPSSDRKPATGDSADKRRRFTPWVLGAGVGAVALATVITAVASNLNSPAPAAAPTAPTASSSSAPRPAPTAPPRPTAPSDANADGPLPFTASSDCDEAGSTPAQSVAVADSPTPWICVLNGPGQRLDLVLGPPGMPQSYVITGVVIVPGAIGRPGRPDTEPDPWLAHQVVTRLQWSFNDPANTVKPQNTFNVRGEAPMAIPHITASKVTIIIQQTSPPPAPQPSATEQPAPGGVFGSVLGPPAPPTGTPGGAFALDGNEPGPGSSLRTFAVSSIKIIGHKAI
ncbi:hypothetical protein [Mycobacterium sp. MAC_080597_8934]|jgi:hypothetical protein|uniref:hypothetical protein n=1 Tax=Mycobacterium sp. MAC_080597_8934 TaxID=1335322 RepID=UPI0009DDAC9B|nr:hypothetical protein [Mycobacterium sp. MAC_080597_8934]